ncbi:hypothetical protein F4818DRAFT_453040 [Hypoxylon cercidicola]|nr:hypothetical protein F4818DRAFT_453040 [Hypoxylon cercidicola]
MPFFKCLPVFTLLYDLINDRERAIEVAAEELHEERRQNEQLRQTLETRNKQMVEYDELKENEPKLQEQITQLQSRNVELQTGIAERDANVWASQPMLDFYRIEDGTADYEHVFHQVQEWVESWCGPIANSDVLQAQAVEHARGNQAAISDFAGRIQGVADVRLVTRFGEVDLELITAFIMRYLWEFLFESTLGNSAPEAVVLLDTIEESLNNHAVDPKPNPLQIASWRALSRRGLVLHPDVRERRNQAVQRLSNELARMLCFVRRNGTEEHLAETISRDIMEPAMAIHERLLSTLIDCRMQMDLHFRAGERFSGEMADLEGVQMFDAAADRRRLVIESLHPRPSVQDFRRQLHILFSLSPAFVARTRTILGLSEPILTCRERLIVAWNSEGKQDGQQSESWLYNVISTAGNGQH